MTTAAIICEYNPFHNGHLYQIEQIKEQLHPDHIIAIMSGDFVQRGAPAFISKRHRAAFALSSGIDLVFELPVCYATASAEMFAWGGVTLANNLQCTDYLVFGAECDDIDLLSKCAELFVHEPDEYKTLLKSKLREGLSFPAARVTAASKVLDSDLAELLNKPNNILAIEYLKALKRCDSTIEPYIIKRKGAGYHQQTLAETNPSASGIRNHIMDAGYSSKISESVPSIVADFLQKFNQIEYPVITDDFSDMVFYRLLTEQQPDLYLDYHPEMHARLLRFAKESNTISELITKTKSKNFTHTRISRYLIHLLLNITVNQCQSDCPYGKILGFRKDHSDLLKQINATSKIPVIQKTSQYRFYLDSEASSSFTQTLTASKLYEHIIRTKFGQPVKNELEQPLLIV